MDPFVILGNFTEKGVDTLHDLAARLEKSRKIVEKAGGRWVGFWLTMGKYDFVAIIEMPDAAAMASVLLEVAEAGNSRTETLHAFSEADAVKIATGQ
jgi:uncharacterized protein with GYD domain